MTRCTQCKLDLKMKCVETLETSEVCNYTAMRKGQIQSKYQLFS